MYTRLIIFTLIGLTACTQPAGQKEDLTDYLGPKPGKVYVYQAGDLQVTLETRSLEWAEASVTVQETMRVEPPVTFAEGRTVSQGVRRFRYLVRDGRLMQESGGTRSTLLKPSPFGGIWMVEGVRLTVSQEDGEAADNGSKQTFSMPCYMNPPHTEKLFGQLRRVLSSTCRNEVDGESFQTTTAFAQGIGFIRTTFGDGSVGSELVDIRDESPAPHPAQ